MKRKFISILLTTSMVLMSVASARAGGPFESFDITAGTPSPIPGHILARTIQIRWDPRTIPVPYRVNNTLNPIPNPLGPAFRIFSGFEAIRRCSPNNLREEKQGQRKQDSTLESTGWHDDLLKVFVFERLSR